jgi:acetyl esterase/lipase
MLAANTGLHLFMPHYRLTPEHPHPAQAEDALEAWAYLTLTHGPKEIVVLGDSAGGHMALTLLQDLKRQNVAQPALCIGLCPWTDIGNRGQSLTENNRYDLVQGWMALKFGEWLDPGGQFGRQALSPICQDFSGTAPIYLQAGGREILRDMIVEFAEVQKANGAQIVLDVWPDMPHNFQAYDGLKQSSTEALHKIRNAIAAHLPQ